MRKKYILSVTALAASVIMSGCTAVNGEPSAAVNADIPIPSLTTMEKLTESLTDTDTDIAEYADFGETAADRDEAVPAGGETQTSAVETSVSETYAEQNADVPAAGVESISLTFYSVTLETGQSKMPIVTMSPENAADKSEIWTSSDESVASVDDLGNITAVSEGSCTVRVTSAQNPDVFADVEVTVTAGVQITYIDGILVVNKTYALPADYNPGVNAEAQAAFDRMQAAAADEGLNIYISSGFRSYDYQAGLYQRYVNKDGKAEADRYSARAGHSEHQTGLAFDLNSIDESFADTEEGNWVNLNCHKYGFIIRYPADKEDVTGYKWEPWHIRYLGGETARAVYDSGLCLEEYLGITSEYAE
ncbi:MAG: D-alanyl-D-alanine carboxypeptidase family protein [Prevotella sp.]|nr:D-alanyl-D-alanine carboxypeptidase family protein [Prevotella sp.]